MRIHSTLFFWLLIGLLLALGVGQNGYGQVTQPSIEKPLKTNQDDFLPKDSVFGFAYSDSGLSKSALAHFHYGFTREDLLSSGARDLFEFLSSLPSIVVGLNIEGGITMGMRGNDARQMAALIVDGTLMNDGYNGAFQLAGKFAMGQIEKLDIYVGPNPISFGNISAFGAIIIQTKAFKPFSGVSTEWAQGFHTSSKDARVSSGLSIGKRGALWSIAATTSISRSVISFSNYTDKFNQTYAMETDSWLSNRFASVQARYKNTSLSLMSDLYQVSTRDADGHSTSQPYVNEFITYAATLRHYERLTPRATFYALLVYKSQDPYKATSEVSAPDSADFEKVWVRVQRGSAQVHVNYQVSKSVVFTLGGQGLYDLGTDKLRQEYFEKTNFSRRYNILSPIARLQYTHKETSLFLGFRNDNHQYSGSFNSYTANARQGIGASYVRVSYSDMYRFPTLSNVDRALNGMRITPIHTQSIDGEIGWNFNSISLGANAFFTKTSNILVYQQLVNGDDLYYNGGTQAIGGTEFFINKHKGKFRFRSGLILMENYANKYGDNPFTVNGQKHSIGFSNKKWSSTITGPLYKSLRFSLLAVVDGPRYYVKDFSVHTADSVKVVTVSTRTFDRLATQLTCNAWLHFKVNIANGIDVSTGVADIFNSKVKYIQLYTGDHRPLPGPSREFLIRISYALAK